MVKGVKTPTSSVQPLGLGPVREIVYFYSSGSEPYVWQSWRVYEIPTGPRPWVKNIEGDVTEN